MDRCVSMSLRRIVGRRGLSIGDRHRHRSRIPSQLLRGPLALALITLVASIVQHIGEIHRCGSISRLERLVAFATLICAFPPYVQS